MRLPYFFISPNNQLSSHPVKTDQLMRSYFILFLLLPYLTIAQICTGNLGDNIFESGDFGKGETFNVLEDPGIAPGYLYDRNGPPSDGYYTITSNTGAWSSLYGTWMTLRDNSADPNGYMMVVNASYEEGVFYEQTIEGLCDNTLYTFSADIINVVKQNVTGHHDPNVSFLLNGEVKYNTGNIRQTERWNTYGFTFTPELGQTTVTLTLRNNAPGGIGNDLALDNISFRACGPEALILPVEIANICEDGDPIKLDATIVGNQYSTPTFQWQRSFDEGETWEDIVGETGSSLIHTEKASGFYYYRYLLANENAHLTNTKCRVNSNIKIVHVVPKFYTIVDTLCQGLSFELNNVGYDQTGVYVDSLISSLGCDSIVTLDLTIVPDRNVQADVQTTNPTCSSFSDGVIRIENVRQFYPPFRIEVTDEFPESMGVFENLAANTYVARVTDHFGCFWEKTIAIEDPEPFVIDVGADITIDLGDSIRLFYDQNYAIVQLEWQPDFCETDCSTTNFYPIQNDTYTLEAFSEQGCQASDSLKITVIPVRKVYIPNTFAPDGQQENQRFTVFGDTPNVQRILSLRIFDRWGGLVFEQFDFAPNDADAGWDGQINRQLTNGNPYIYSVEVLFLDEAIKNFSGELMIVGQ
ncbi:MAG: gliding motility-associated C-terminal domain-containing protein [Bacteroidota bacterium]